LFPKEPVVPVVINPTFDSMITSVSSLPTNAATSITVTLLGMVILDSLLLANAEGLIDVTLVGIVTSGQVFIDKC